jgi:hypothetical protein
VRSVLFLGPAFFLLIPAVSSAEEPTLGWPEVIAHLTKEKEQAVACLGLLKSRGNDANRVKATYELARGDVAAVIGGLEIVLVEGGTPEKLPTTREFLERSGKSLKNICDAALKTSEPGTKGVWEEIAKGAVEPLIKAISDGIGAAWTLNVDKDKLAIETKKTKLEAARWPDFATVKPL